MGTGGGGGGGEQPAFSSVAGGEGDNAGVDQAVSAERGKIHIEGVTLALLGVALKSTIRN